MTATRCTQPYRTGQARTPGAALSAMMRGRSPTLGNPRDAHRSAQKQARRGRVARTPYASLHGRAKRVRYQQAFKSEAQRRLIFHLASQGTEWARKWLVHKGMKPPAVRRG